MSELIGKVYNEYKNILNHESNIVSEFDFSNVVTIEFTPSHKLDEEEWFIIENLSTKDFFIDECRNDYSTASLNQISNSDYKNTSAIIIKQNGCKYFQRITKSLYVDNKTFLGYSGAPIIVEHCNQVLIKKESDAVYNPNTDILYFKSIGKLKEIFIGIEELHREATQEEVNSFVDNDFIGLGGKMTNTSIGTMNRKRIADIGQKYNSLPSNKKTLLIQYAREKAGVDLESNTFLIKNENDLKKVLFAMDQRYYYADIYEENRVANSVRIVN